MFLLSALGVAAQEATVSGVVTAADDNSPLQGVAVQVKGTASGTNTDAAGRYSLQAPRGGTLVFRFVGLNTAAEAIGNRTVINVQLSTSATDLNEVIVTGFGSQIKQDLTGNIARVKGTEIQAMPVPTVDAAL